MEKSLRKNANIYGTWLLLGDGQKWCFSPMPLGKNSLAIIESLEDFFTAQQNVLSAAKNGGPQTEAIKAFISAAKSFALAALRINYPGITEEYFDEHDLVTAKQVNTITKIVQGDDEISEVCNCGEREKNEVEAMP